jgi:hypothetical protein
MSHSHFYVYKIYSDKGNKVYYGSTIRNPLTRWKEHKVRYKNESNQCVSNFLFDEYGLDHCFFEVIEDCKTEEEARNKEKNYIINNKCINIQTPCITKEEKKQRDEKLRKENCNNKSSEENKRIYTDEHKDNKKEYDKLYREANKEYLNKKIECECGGKYILRHKSTHFITKKHLEYVKKK